MQKFDFISGFPHLNCNKIAIVVIGGEKRFDVDDRLFLLCGRYAYLPPHSRKNKQGTVERTCDTYKNIGGQRCNVNSAMMMRAYF